jgi:HSP20 family protein
MTIIRRPSPFSELVTLRQAMDRLFDDRLFRPLATLPEDFGRLALDVRTTPEAIVVQAELPGMAPEDVDITIESGTLTIRAEQKEERTEESGEYLVREISRGSLMRSVTLPSGLEADRAEATFEHGVLTLRIPKAEETKPRQIRIRPVVAGTAEPAKK